MKSTTAAEWKAAFDSEDFEKQYHCDAPLGAWLDETGTQEVLYGTVGTAPYGLAEYGDGTEMVLRYVTPVLGGDDVELLLRYENTVLAEITLHTLKEDE